MPQKKSQSKSIVASSISIQTLAISIHFHQLVYCFSSSCRSFEDRDFRGRWRIDCSEMLKPTAGSAPISPSSANHALEIIPMSEWYANPIPLLLLLNLFVGNPEFFSFRARLETAMDSAAQKEESTMHLSIDFFGCGFWKPMVCYFLLCVMKWWREEGDRTEIHGKLKKKTWVPSLSLGP